jgi:methyltransferase (TIGR00027 family)
MSTISHVSDTAFWVAMHRAEESKRPDALFQDPLVDLLTGEKGKSVAEIMKKSTAWKYSYWTVVIRTCLIDELIQTYITNGSRCIINLGAGLDTRPYRLNLPPDTQWFELDFPDIIEHKKKALSHLQPNFNLQHISVDLSEHDARKETLAHLNSVVKSALILTEGVVPYLTEEQVKDLATDLKTQPNFTYWITEYYSPKIYPKIQAQAFQKRLGSAPFRFFPPDCLDFYTNHGWPVKELHYLYDEGEKHNRPFPLPWFFKVIKPFVNQEKFRKDVRVTGYVVLEKG